MKKYLIIMQQDPTVNSLALEGFEFALALSAFEQNVSLLFKGAGIQQLLRNQDPDKIILKDFTKAYAGLSLFGIEDVYVEQASMQDYANADLLIQPQVVDADKIKDLVAQHEIVISI